MAFRFPINHINVSTLARVVQIRLLLRYNQSFSSEDEEDGGLTVSERGSKKQPECILQYFSVLFLPLSDIFVNETRHLPAPRKISLSCQRSAHMLHSKIGGKKLICVLPVTVQMTVGSEI